MKKFVNLWVIIFISVLFLSPVIPAKAISSNILITEVQTTGNSASEEFVEIYNGTSAEVVLDGWKMQYQSSTPSNIESWTTKFLFPENTVITGHSFMLLATEEFKNSLSYPGMVSAEFSSTFATNGGHIRLIDGNNFEIDKVGYGTATNPESSAAEAPVDSESIKRCSDSSGMFVDTDDNSKDFKKSTRLLGQFGPTCVSQQQDDNNGHGTDDNDNQQDTDTDTDGSTEQNQNFLPVTVSELLPNPGSPLSDAQDEFVELYNPNEEAVDLAGYMIQTGNSFQYSYVLPTITLSSHGYKSFYSLQTNLTLSNSGGKARVLDPEGNILHASESYGAIGEDISWALVDGEWITTDRVTPDESNLAPTEVFINTDGKGALAPCAPGKYRNPATNRCKNIETASSLQPCRSDQYRNPATNRCKSKSSNSTGLKPCAADQYRNPETNRCKKINTASSTLKPCNSDQYRNPGTNRCKKIGSDTGLKPCEEGYERNTDTNRCRKVAGITTGGPASVATITGNPVSYGAVAIVGGGLFAYAIYEYRLEISKFLSKVKK